MAIAIMGAGAVGCYYGALLAEAGEAVTLIGRPALVQAVAAQGLRFETGGTTRHIPVAASDTPAAVAGADLVLVTVKSGDTEAAARAILPHLAPETVVLSLQNGISNAETLTALLGRPVVPVVVYVATDMAGPGHVRHHGRGELVLAQAPGAETAAARLRAAGIVAEVSPTAATAMWTKFTINCALNAVSALSMQPYGRIIAEPGADRMMQQIMAECLTVASASNIPMPDTLWPEIEAITRSMAGQFSSTAQDLRRGKPTEIDHLNGEVARRAALLGIEAPLNAALAVLVRLAQTRAEDRSS